MQSVETYFELGVLIFPWLGYAVRYSPVKLGSGREPQLPAGRVITRENSWHCSAPCRQRVIYCVLSTPSAGSAKHAWPVGWTHWVHRQLRYCWFRMDLSAVSPSWAAEYLCHVHLWGGSFQAEEEGRADWLCAQTCSRVREDSSAGMRSGRSKVPWSDTFQVAILKRHVESQGGVLR